MATPSDDGRRHTEDGPWVTCPRCPERVGLARFAEDDDEPGLSVAVCDGCGERVLLIAPPDLP